MIRFFHGLIGFQMIASIGISWKYPETAVRFDAIYYFSLNIFVLISACLYIPLYFSVRKFRYLASAISNKPETYILWQLMALLVEKTFILFYIYFVFGISIEWLTLKGRPADDESILLVVQLAYIGYCTQIPDSKITNGATFYLPGPNSQLQPIPANFNCTYTIKAPASGFYANVNLLNGLKGVNDYFYITEMDGLHYYWNSRDNQNLTFRLIPGSQVTIQVVTKSVLMNSKFSITVDYHTAHIGSTVAMKTGREMNYLDVSAMKSSSSDCVTTTLSASEPILILLASEFHKLKNYYDDIFFIDGTITNQAQILRINHVADPTVTTTKFLTVIVFGKVPAQFVFNLASDAKLFNELLAWTVTAKTETLYTNGNVDEAMEFVNFESDGIVMDNLNITTTSCKARVMSGPPNSSSKLLLDLSTNPKMPHKFDVKYFTVIEDGCAFSYSLKSS